ncbi:MAG: hypothetical protein AWM53_01996 [Candidatus Dichloromethanomonas elyunquensis]|nr:MAG: hypothetical protein AWM53_01996 [Candidatus Dichloromethanomonas elyunquensis]
MYYDLLFPYRIEAGAKIGTQENGEQLPVYTKITLGKAKKPITEEEYDKMHEANRITLANILHEKIELITPISGEEYEENANEEDDRDE